MTRALWLADVARAAGNLTVEPPGWRSAGRDELDPHYIVIHHTASPPGKNAPSLKVVTEGRSDLGPPLCNYLVGRDGTTFPIASGRANHAGVCQYPDGTDGNRRSLGIECENNGVGEPWPAVQMEAIVRLCAAICRKLGWGADRVVGHKEIARPKGRKIDPSFDMPTFRAAVARQLTGLPPNDGDDELTKDEHLWLQGLMEQLTSEKSLPLLNNMKNVPGKVDALDAKVVKLTELVGKLLEPDPTV